mmetsp:Transcript_122525/g.381404  ORF Transcript_122525/g.381404 Transcript_122525/m.381404 type:complete len:572 (+) Transcript_122525:2078-3793(+)
MGVPVVAELRHMTARRKHVRQPVREQERGLQAAKAAGGTGGLRTAGPQSLHGGEQPCPDVGLAVWPQSLQGLQGLLLPLLRHVRQRQRRVRLLVEGDQRQPITILEGSHHSLHGVLDNVKHNQSVVLDRAVLCLVCRPGAHRTRHVHDAADVDRYALGCVCNTDTNSNINLLALVRHILAGRDGHGHCVCLWLAFIVILILGPLVVIVLTRALQLAVQLLLKVLVHRRPLAWRLCGLALVSTAALEDPLDPLHAGPADGAAAGVPLDGPQALLAAALVPTRHDQEVGGLVKANGAGAPLRRGSLATGPLASGSGLLEAPDHALCDLRRLQHALDPPDPAGEERQDPPALAPEDINTLPERALVVAVAGHEAGGDLGGRWYELQMVDVPGLRVDPAVGGPPDQHLVGHLQREDAVDPDLAQEGLRLFARAGETVQQAAALLHVCLSQAVADEANDELVGDEATPVHEVLCLQAQLSATSAQVAEDVAGREMHKAKFIHERPALRALSRRRRAEDNVDAALADGRVLRRRITLRGRVSSVGAAVLGRSARGRSKLCGTRSRHRSAVQCTAGGS